MSGPLQVEKQTKVIELGNEDFFQRFNLRKVKSLEKGLAGEVFLVTPRSNPKRNLAVKTFSLSSYVRERSLQHFTREVEVMQAVHHLHLVPCIMAARCKKYSAIVMPYYPEGEISFSGKLDLRHVPHYMCHVAKPVEHLHTKKHRPQ